jgi:hypothetical protein
MHPTNQTKTRVIQEAVLDCVRFLLIVVRPDLHIATVLDARSLPTVVVEVTIIKFCDQIMRITSIIISVCSLWVDLSFQFFHCFFSRILFLLRLQGNPVCGFCASLGLIELHHRLQHIWSIWIHRSS